MRVATLPRKVARADAVMEAVDVGAAKVMTPDADMFAEEPAQDVPVLSSAKGSRLFVCKL